MADWLFWGVVALPVAYIIFYIWALIFRIIPWLNIAITELYKLTLLQLVATMIFLTGGFFLFAICLIFVIGMVLNR